MNETIDKFGFVLNAMRADEERGAYPQVAVHIELYETAILDEGEGEVKTAYLAIEARVAAGFEYERKHGKWSLLKQDHPLTVKLRQLNSRAYSAVALKKPVSVS